MDSATYGSIVTAWRQAMQNRGFAPQTVADELRSLELYREQLQYCGYDVDHPNRDALREIAEGWKYRPQQSPGKALDLDYVANRLGGVRRFFSFAAGNGYVAADPLTP